MQFITKFAILAILATLVVADDESAGNSTAPATNGTTAAGNGTVLDDGSTGNSTLPAANGTATNGTATNGTATNGTAPSTPEPSGGSTRRSLRACEYECPSADRASHALLLATRGADTFTCTFVLSAGPCSYQAETGVLNDDQNGGNCPQGAFTSTPGCLAGNANNGGVLKSRARKHKRSSREMQYEAIARRFLL